MEFVLSGLNRMEDDEAPTAYAYRQYFCCLSSVIQLFGHSSICHLEQVYLGTRFGGRIIKNDNKIRYRLSTEYPHSFTHIGHLDSTLSLGQ
jgi:hypothetical protein